MVSNLAGIDLESSAPDSITNKIETKGKKNIFHRFQHWFSELSIVKKILIIIAIFFFFALILSTGIYAYIIYVGNSKLLTGGSVKPTAISTPTPTPTPITMVNPLTGEVFDKDRIPNLERAPIAAMVENSTDARPQFGMNQADIVYDTLAEGGIDRWMGIFLGNTPSKIEPIRSARTYYLDWVREYNAIYTHWGANSDVAPNLNGIRNLDEFNHSGEVTCNGKNTNLFCRDSGRYAPHNGVALPSNIWEYAKSPSVGWGDASDIKEWTFKEDGLLGARGTDGMKINVNFEANDPGYNHSWIYNQKDNNFVRYNDLGKPMLDALDNSPLTAKNIIIRFVDGHIYRSSGGKDVYNLTNTGSGKASFFVDGKQIEGNWTRASLSDRTMFTDSAGASVGFDKGRTWIIVLVNGTGSFNIK